MEMRELDFNGRRQKSRSGLDNHRHHLRVEEGVVAVETKRITVVHMPQTTLALETF